ncbi:MAG: response regulator [Oliverpabstia sp.]
MKSVLIVDDELLARLGIKSLISWKDYGYEIIGEAENGQQALELTEELHPDILLCDMKMPVMDGLTLIHRLKELESSPQVIATSAYDEFHYVKQALKEGACDYLLKSELGPDGLLQALENASSRLAADSLGHHVFTAEHLKLLREDFLNNLFSNRTLPDTYIRDQQKLLNIQLPTEHFYCISLKIFPPENGSIQLSELEETIEEVLSNTLKNYGIFLLLMAQPDHVLILIQPHIDLNMLSGRDFLISCTEGLEQMISMLFNCTCYMGASRVCSSLSELPAARQQALDAMEKSIFNKAFFTQYTSHFTDAHTEFNRTLERELKDVEQALETMDDKRIRKSFDSLIQKINLLETSDQKYLRSVCHTLIFIVNRQASLHSIETDQIWDFDPHPYETASDFQNRWQYCRWIQQLSSSFLQVINPEQENQRIILEAKKYIRSHYASALSLNFMADYLGLSPNYFSKIFKKYTGTGFVDYLTDLRLKKAEELLKSGKYKIYEISSLVGYENSTYFSRIFKKKYGYSPYQVKTDISC